MTSLLVERFVDPDTGRVARITHTYTCGECPAPEGSTVMAIEPKPGKARCAGCGHKIGLPRPPREHTPGASRGPASAEAKAALQHVWKGLPVPALTWNEEVTGRCG